MATRIDTTAKAGANNDASKDAEPIFEDNAQLVDDALTRLQNGFKTGKTKKYAYRVGQLKQLKKGLQTMAAELSKAMTSDLDKDDFTNWMFETRTVEREVEHALKHLKSWMKD